VKQKKKPHEGAGEPIIQQRFEKGEHSEYPKLFPNRVEDTEPTLGTQGKQRRRPLANKKGTPDVQEKTATGLGAGRRLIKPVMV